MSDRNALQREHDVRELVRKARQNTDPAHHAYREVLHSLIELTQSPASRLKMLAAREIPNFFNYFADLEEDSINAIYDLCEDPESSVRIEGYLSIGRISKTDNKWIKRNADVLIQLLQSDEPTEAKRVREALVQHINLDPAVTLGVFCDQIIPSDDAADEEEQALRVRLRELVLEFLKDKAQITLEQHVLPDTPVETVLVQRIANAITQNDHFHQLDQSHITLLIQDIVGQLQRSPKLQAAALDALYKHAEQCANSKSSEDPTKALFYLDEVGVLLRKQVASEQARFLRSTSSSLLKLSRSLPTGLQAPFIGKLVNYFGVLYDSGEELPVPMLQQQLAILSPNLLQALFSDKKASVEPTSETVAACSILLRACRQHQSTGPWSPNASLLPHLKHISGAQSSDARWTEAQNLARALEDSIPSGSTPASSAQEHRPASVPPRPNSHLMGFQRSRPPHSSQGQPTSASPSLRVNSLSEAPPLAAPLPTKRGSFTNGSPRPAKKARKDNTEAHPPSLLKRLSGAPSPTNGAAHSPWQSGEAKQMSQPRNHPQSKPLRNPPTPTAAPPFLSIKGAANRAESSDSVQSPASRSQASRPPVEHRSGSLMDRITPSSGEGGNSKNKKR